MTHHPPHTDFTHEPIDTLEILRRAMWLVETDQERTERLIQDTERFLQRALREKNT